MEQRICGLVYLLLLSTLMLACSASSPQLVGTADGNQSGAVDALPALTAVALQAGERLRVVATTTLVADAVARIGGDAIGLTALLKPGADPHAYQATPEDLRAITNAHLVFINGLGLEESLSSILRDAQAKTVTINVGVPLIIMNKDGPEGEAYAGEEPPRGANPHTWWSIAAVEQWTVNIATSLAVADPSNQASYEANGAAYRAELENLRHELEARVAPIPLAQRKLATDHDTLAYFARDFDFQIVGLVVPSFGTMTEPSAQHLAALQNQLRGEGVHAIFVASTVNPRLAEQLAQDLGIQIVPLFTDSLSAPDGPAANYVEFMRYTVDVIVKSLMNGQ